MAAALALLAPPGASGQEVSLTVTRQGSLVRAGAVFRWEREEELLATLREGLESRITFTLRLFEESPGLRSLFGDRLLAEKVITRSAYYNFLDADYIVEDADGGQAAFTDLAALLRGFFTVTAEALAVLRRDRRGSFYAAAQVQFDPVRLMPPLTIVSLAGAGGRFTTPWVRAEIPR